MTGAQQAAATAIEKLAPRQALHAALLMFRHPATGVAMQFASEWPEDLRAALEAAAHENDSLARPNLLEYFDFFEHNAE